MDKCGDSQSTNANNQILKALGIVNIFRGEWSLLLRQRIEQLPLGDVPESNCQISWPWFSVTELVVGFTHLNTVALVVWLSQL